MSNQPGAKPGFYPAENGRQRYWDGNVWTDRYADMEAPPAPPAAPKKKNWFRRHKILTGLGLLILLGIIISAANGGKSSTPTVASSSSSSSAPVAAPPAAPPAAPSSAPAAPKSTAPAAPPAPAAPGLNASVRDGKFEFVVTKVDCGKSQVGSNPLVKKAQGQFCLVSLTVKNVANESQYLDGGSQMAMDAQGRKFSADSTAGIYLGDQGNTFLTPINPGNSVQGQVVFDIPKDAKIVKIELHDSPFSQGVAVAVG